MRYKVRGSTVQVVDFELKDGESLFCESSGMAWMTSNIEAKETMKGGITRGITRMLEGQSVFLTTYTCKGPLGLITFASQFTGKIVPVELKEGQELICQKSSSLCCQTTVAIDFFMRKPLAKGIFGWQSLVFHKFTGPGLIFMEIAGDVTEYKLQENQILKVDPGHVVMYETSVTNTFSSIKGSKHWIFGGKKTYICTFKGPGRLWLQSMSVLDVARMVLPYMPNPKDSGPTIKLVDDGWGLG
jgi:uncharacterized protein (TIGR00266 family)